ncbi:bone morphogenetic protein receptor type-1B-like [Watersipora subatra]|uniref:bone morphogenetic protein receptor type-1B-like n=1 Tax=Watersipora subatra TaxID=2589382 RepID=UPI00355C02A6
MASNGQEFPQKVVIATSVMVGVFLAAVVLFFCKGICERRTKMDKSDLPSFETESSGYGALKLCKRTIAKDLIRQNLIGEGKYGKVYKCSHFTTEYAVKVFTSQHGLIGWSQEKKIYAEVNLHHENLLGFLAADVESCSSVIQYLIVTDYHPNGSLYDYLKAKKSLDIVAVSRILRTIISGLTYLHSEINGQPYKEPLAHRDIKTKNILVKNDGSCCIADLGMAITSKDIANWRKIKSLMQDGDESVSQFIQVGTKRYLAPEILNLSIHSDSLQAFQKADIYSFGLLLWEVLVNSSLCRVEHAPGLYPDKEGTLYHLPYDELVMNNPSFQDMKEVVADKQMRPSTTYGRDAPRMVHHLQTIMEECWCTEPIVRLSALRIQKNINIIDNQPC